MKRKLDFQADDEGSTPFIRSIKAHLNDELFLCLNLYVIWI